MSLICGIECALPVVSQRGDAPEEHGGGREQREPGMPMAIGVPVEELREPAASVCDVVEPAWIVGLVLNGLEARLGERVVVRDARPAFAALDAELREHVDEAQRCHRCAAVVVNGDAARREFVARDGLREELLGEALFSRSATIHATGYRLNKSSTK